MTGGMRLPVNSAAAPAEPVACSVSTVGRMEVVSDTNDAVASVICYCGLSDDSTYDWLTITTNLACPYY